MPSMRRMRLFGIAVFCLVVYMLYLTNSSRNTSPRSADVYQKTKDALNRGTYHPHGPRKGSGDKDDEDEALAAAMSSRLDEAARLAKENANLKSPNPPKEFESLHPKAKPVTEDLEPGKPTNDRNVAGRKKHWEEPQGKIVDQAKGKTEDKPKGETPEQKERKNVKEELNSIFKKAPIIIFSKSYCPHSKRAKGILLDKYNIVPAPHVVELDLHPDGAALQALVGESTGRRTVPNVIINGVSIGGGDETAALDESGGLLDKIKTLAGKKMQVVERRL